MCSIFIDFDGFTHATRSFAHDLVSAIDYADFPRILPRSMSVVIGLARTIICQSFLIPSDPHSYVSFYMDSCVYDILYTYRQFLFTHSSESFKQDFSQFYMDNFG